ncbi:hypothetical protein BDM02DRAFT_3189248 [Thelephora ganbajun]|uniref:Uncharacterized protein n=1 Tax=Thelephora ganbajun TaxID=370292 RepID=A0ACB6Z8U2_THEGA|nr:hypothetical protein BDM02DRAFT_3189248 [Thelephora ganbajun]
MAHKNAYGLVHGLRFSPFVFQFYGVVADLLIVDLQRASEMVGPPQIPNNFLRYRDSCTKVCHPVRIYSRYIDELRVSFRFTAASPLDLVQGYLSANIDPTNDNVIGYDNSAGCEIALRVPVPAALGGVAGILEHTPFQGTLFPSMGGSVPGEGVQFRIDEIQEAPEHSMVRFESDSQMLIRALVESDYTLANPYVGFQVQLGLAGIFFLPSGSDRIGSSVLTCGRKCPKSFRVSLRVFWHGPDPVFDQRLEPLQIGTAFFYH